MNHRRGARGAHIRYLRITLNASLADACQEIPTADVSQMAESTASSIALTQEMVRFASDYGASTTVEALSWVQQFTYSL